MHFPWLVVEEEAKRAAVRRRVVAVLLVPAIAAYNWWIAVPFDHGLLRSPNSFFSDLEVRGAPRAALFGRLDFIAGVLFLTALMVRGREGRAGPRAEWPLFVAFSIAVAVGGMFPFACAEGTNHACRASEWRLQLPAHHYVHVLASAVEFITVSIAVLVAWRRRRGTPHVDTKIFGALTAVLIVAYVPLAVAYFSDHLAALIEPVFFVAFSVAVATEALTD